MANDDFEFDLKIVWNSSGKGTVSGDVKPVKPVTPQGGGGGAGPIKPTAANFTVTLDAGGNPVVAEDFTPKAGSGGPGSIKS